MIYCLGSHACNAKLEKTPFIGMPLKNAHKAYQSLLVTLTVMVLVCSAQELRLTKRNYSGRRCVTHADCSTEARGSVCLREACVCPQGYLPDGCFTVGHGALDHPCNSSTPCGEELTCRDRVCGCPDGFQRLGAHGMTLCLLWHRPTRLVDRCRSNEDCRKTDPNSVCKKRWCQCAAGHQLFETALFGRRHRCFETSQLQCSSFAQCSQLGKTLEQHCVCLYGFCHCMVDSNFTSFDFPPYNPNWYQRWKKDIVLATRLLFVTVVLFFVPCFIYVTLGMRERSRHLFTQLMHSQPPPATVHYHRQRRTSSCPRPSVTAATMTAAPQEDPPPSYDEIVRKDDPPPPYGACR